MATQLPSSPDVLFLKLQAQVMSSMTLGQEDVPIITADRDDEGMVIAQAETMVFLAPGDGSFDTGQTVAAGRICMVEWLSFTARLWTRMALDESTHDDVRLTDPNRGHLQIRHQLINALALFQPIDAGSNWLVAEPVKPLRTTAPRRGKAAEWLSWIRSEVTFGMRYQLALSQSYQ